MKEPDRSSKRGVRAALVDSWRMHSRKPLLLVFGPLAALLLYCFDWITGGGQPLAGDIARLFAFPPLDRFADLGVTEGGSTGWAILPGFLARILIASVFVSAALAVSLSARKLLRVGAVYVVASLSWLVTYLMSVAYYSQLESSALGTGGSLGLLLIFAMLPVHLLLAVVFAPLVIQAAASWRLKLMLRSGRVWVLSALSLWVWYSFARAIDRTSEGAAGIGASLTAAFAQSLLLIALATVVSETADALPEKERGVRSEEVAAGA